MLAVQGVFRLSPGPCDGNSSNSAGSASLIVLGQILLLLLCQAVSPDPDQPGTVLSCQPGVIHTQVGAVKVHCSNNNDDSTDGKAPFNLP